MAKIALFIFFISITFGIPFPTPLHADKTRLLGDVEKHLEKTRNKSILLNKTVKKLNKELGNLRIRSILAAKKERQHAVKLVNYEKNIEHLNRIVIVKNKFLISKKKQFNNLIGFIQRVALQPPIALLLSPSTPSDTVRSALLIRSILPDVEKHSQDLKVEIDSLLETRSAIIKAKNNIKLQKKRLEQQRLNIKKLTSQKIKIMQINQNKHELLIKKIGNLSNEAKNLRQLLVGLGANKKKASNKNIFRTNKAKGNEKVHWSGEDSSGRKLTDSYHLGLPVIGTFEVTYGKTNSNNGHLRGLSIKTKPGTTVISPRKGRVVFAGPFKGLEKLLILEVRNNIHILLVGLESIYIPVGQKVLKGEPIGKVSSTDMNDKILYLELRKNGEPINPLPWLTAGNYRKRG
ncbi:MAG: hypothetical protein CMM83_02895 [Rhodospirillales bacterium]|nr:hypothetical protein [Rhodospirillales bacterium]|tara:strand:- start:974 stop:2185 length:1212 start_codon:yes stop_codon:yes gene_type:complete